MPDTPVLHVCSFDEAGPGPPDGSTVNGGGAIIAWAKEHAA